MNFRFLKPLFRRDKLDADMAEEMRQHLERRTQANLAAGLSPDEARHAAQRQFGGVDQLQEIARDERGVRWVEDIVRGLRHSVRSMIKQPGFTATAPFLSLGAKLLIAGALIGALGAWNVGHAMQGLLFGGTTAIMMVVVLFAVLIPARRAARVSPMEALRAE